ncbi:MAG: FAD-binding oxidoreductase, partial [Pseudolabrys sp.]|nr:FAD-binding oxidoreductase [Pseudolabrys sp.]
MNDAATIHRDLRTGRTIWQDKPVPKISVKTAEGEIAADVLIVGAGMTGAIIADVLANAGLRVAIAERCGPMCGSTMATTALIQFELDTPLLRLGKMIGDRKAQRAWLRSRRAVRDLAERVRDIRCEWCERATLYLAGDLLNGKALRDEADAREDIGLSATFVERNQLLERYGIASEAALRSKGNAECNPVLLAGGLLKRAIERGAMIYA